MSVRVVIQHHPKRAARIPYLLERLPGAIVVTDPDPTCAFTNSWRTYRECLHHAPKDGYLLIVQDDVEPCDHLIEACEKIGHGSKGAVVCLWQGMIPQRNAMAFRHAESCGQHYAIIRSSPWVPLVSTLWPAQLARRFADWSDKAKLPRTMRSDDAVASRFLKFARARILVTVPCLVEHPDHDSIRKQPRGRTALTFIGDADPRKIDWRW